MFLIYFVWGLQYVRFCANMCFRQKVHQSDGAGRYPEITLFSAPSTPKRSIPDPSVQSLRLCMISTGLPSIYTFNNIV